jgi:hypothetical protein
MQVHAFKGTGRVFGFTQDATGSNLPSRFGPWSPFKTLDMSRGGEPNPGVRTDECLDNIEKHGIHVTEAHVRITDTLI